MHRPAPEATTLRERQGRFVAGPANLHFLARHRTPAPPGRPAPFLTRLRNDARDATAGIAGPTRLLLVGYALLGTLPSILLARGHGPWALAAAGLVAVAATAAAFVVGHRVDDTVARLAVAADIDTVTGARSRRWGEAHLRRVLARADQDECYPVLALVDLDRFKAVNDTYGHVAGDRTLRAVARALDESLRIGDWAARWGGDEFLVVIDAQIDDALDALERIRAIVTRLDAPLVPAGLSISVGVTCAGRGDTLEGALERADRALYAVKASGGDAVRLVPPD